jgi:hypothetical protein
MLRISEMNPCKFAMRNWILFLLCIGYHVAKWRWFFFFWKCIPFLFNFFSLFKKNVVEQRKQPELRGLPTAVVQYNEWKGGALIAVSYEARKLGVNR